MREGKTMLRKTVVAGLAALALVVGVAGPAAASNDTYKASKTYEWANKCDANDVRMTIRVHGWTNFSGKIAEGQALLYTGNCVGEHADAWSLFQLKLWRATCSNCAAHLVVSGSADTILNLGQDQLVTRSTANATCGGTTGDDIDFNRDYKIWVEEVYTIYFADGTSTVQRDDNSLNLVLAGSCP